MIRPSRIAPRLGLCLVLCAALLPWTARAEIDVEDTVQYALENLVSGTAATVGLGGTEVAVTPVRTWKSVSGHWCRRYALVITEPGGMPERSEATRCRQDGIWKKLAE